MSLFAAPSFAAEIWYQPIVGVSAESNSNVDFTAVDADKRSAQGYLLDGASIIGINTPRSQTLLKPHLRYQDYPKEDGLNQVEGTFDLNSRYRSPRSNWTLLGRYEHRDELHAQISEAEFNDVNPDAPTGTDTGRVRAGATRQTVLLAPGYTYRLSERLNVGALGTYQMRNYDPDDSGSHVDFNYGLAKAFIGWNYSQRTEVSVGAFASRYDAKNIDSQSDSVGGSIDFAFQWSPTLESTLTTNYQSTDIKRTEPTVFSGTSNAFGAEFRTAWKREIDTLRFNVGRTIAPSGAGGLYKSDQARFQYDRELSERLSVTGAVRWIRDRSLNAVVAGSDRDYGRGQVGFEYLITRTWFINGQYEFLSQKYLNDINGSAENNIFTIQFGYQGLGRPR